MNIGFIHIGMMKTASTYMQNLWFKDQSYCTCVKSPVTLIGQLQELVQTGKNNSEIPLQIQIDESYTDGQTVVVSNEGFSTAFLNSPEFQNKIPQYIEKSSTVLGGLLPNLDNLLIIVREPLSWIKSIFNQSIVEGGYWSANEFVAQQEAFIKHSFDLEHIVNSYSKYFKNIQVLPYELFKEKEEQFWSTVSERFGVPVPKGKLDRIHQSMVPAKIFLLANLNRLSHQFISQINSNKTYTEDELYANERATLNANYYVFNQWAHRRFVQFSPEDKIEDMKNKFQFEQSIEDFFSFKIPKKVKLVIQNNYVKFFSDKEYFDQELIENYKACL